MIILFSEFLEQSVRAVDYLEKSALVQLFLI